MEIVTLTFIIIGASASLFSSILVIIEICLVKYKDMANILIMALVIIDVLMSLSIYGIIEPVSVLICEISMWICYFIRDFHKIMVLFIARSLYTIIVRSKQITFTFIKLFFFIGFGIDLLKTLFFALASQVFINHGVCASKFYNSYLNIVFLFADEILPSTIILFIIAYYYYKIRISLMKEALESDIKILNKRIFAKRLIGFGIVFSILIIPVLIITLIQLFGLSLSFDRLLSISLMVYAWYPFCNSLVYGFTKSFKKNIFSICIKTPDFENKEDYLYVLRQANIIRPRFYLDLIGESEHGDIN
ncbi:hypothetical protein SteCoe_18084 [Stentor coeruleus]|uniref:G-protein coupled receptors family 1 profile domain-containing protein n=1 Tax=Stentor coeruleus TaxID=5963 RepID=A0A1R2BXH9_9CILI|nr:hypothetical protein SteCoe_18084 [Stentor coeruleus]